MNTNDMILCYNMMHRSQEEEITHRPPVHARHIQPIISFFLSTKYWTRWSFVLQMGFGVFVILWIPSHNLHLRPFIVCVCPSLRYSKLVHKLPWRSLTLVCVWRAFIWVSMGDLGPVDRSSIGSHDLLFLPFSYLLYYINIIDNSSPRLSRPSLRILTSTCIELGPLCLVIMLVPF